MRIVIDMQGAQASNCQRGIGRYTLAFAKSLVRNSGGIEVFLVLNGCLEETILPLRQEFEGLLPPDRIHVWYAVGPIDHMDEANLWRRNVAEMTREAAIASINPSVVVVSSMFEGLGDDAVTSIGALTDAIPTATILFDLIPALSPEIYLANPAVASWYESKIGHLRKASLLLAISESSRQEALDYFGLAAERVVSIGADAAPQFTVRHLEASDEQTVRAKYQLKRPFAMYTGGIDHRKNIEGLIRGWALLPEALRSEHTLAIVCSIQDFDRRRLLNLAQHHGLAEDEINFTGYVPENDLIDLYNLCKIFVFPSLHEGFGLPALEAMRCGRAVIAANTSSLPEVVGREDAMFDPYDDAAIAKKIEHLLTDDVFRKQLERHALTQSLHFSWDETGNRAIQALENLYSVSTTEHSKSVVTAARRPRLAYVSPLPPARSGIADYSAELLPELARFYEIDLIVLQKSVSLSPSLSDLSVHSVDWFWKHAQEFDRIIYHFGNSDFHSHMFAMLAKHPGIVVLHDFYLSGVVAHMEAHRGHRNIWVKSLYEGHGYKALQDRYNAADTASVVWQYPCSYEVLRNAQGVIVHSEYSVSLASHWYGRRDLDKWEVIPLLRAQATPDEVTRDKARSELGLDDTQFVVCSFGLLGRTKLNHRLLKAWLDSALARDEQCILVFVGENDAGKYGADLVKSIRSSEYKNRIRITGWTEPETFKSYLLAADVAVQLRTLSRGETSAAVLDCMGFGLPTVVNANGSMADIESDCVWKLPDEFTDEELAEALSALYRDPERRQALGRCAQAAIRKNHDPTTCARTYFEAIERFSKACRSNISSLVQLIAALDCGNPSGDCLLTVAQHIDRSVQPHLLQRQLLVDVSELVQRDARSGIQRVVREILQEWLTKPSPAYRIEPIYVVPNSIGYRYARKFTLGFMGCPIDSLSDEPVTYRAGDKFVGLDLQPAVVTSHRAYYRAMRDAGVSVRFVVYDLLPIQLPQYFLEGAKLAHEKWLEVVTEQDGAICISKSVGESLRAWVDNQNSEHSARLEIDWFHLGANPTKSAGAAAGLHEGAHSMLTQIQQRTSFLLVGTIEPRKGYEQVLDAFEHLWADGVQVNLVLVGKQGWMVEVLVERLRNHSEAGHRLFWLESTSDEYLERLYGASACLIAASYGEGFGLPLIEAAQHSLPIIARDLPVFREVAGEHAYYFNAAKAEDLAQAVSAWLALYREGNQPPPDKLPWLTWMQSATQLRQFVLGTVT